MRRGERSGRRAVPRCLVVQLPSLLAGRVSTHVAVPAPGGSVGGGGHHRGRRRWWRRWWRRQRGEQSRRQRGRLRQSGVGGERGAHELPPSPVAVTPRTPREQRGNRLDRGPAQQRDAGRGVGVHSRACGRGCRAEREAVEQQSDRLLLCRGGVRGSACDGQRAGGGAARRGSRDSSAPLLRQSFPHSSHAEQARMGGEVAQAQQEKVINRVPLPKHAPEALPASGREAAPRGSQGQVAQGAQVSNRGEARRGEGAKAAGGPLA